MEENYMPTFVNMKNEKGQWIPVPALMGNKGADGFSPEAKVENTEDGVEITITDKDGTTKQKIKTGDAIDDNVIAADKTWSSEKINSNLSEFVGRTEFEELENSVSSVVSRFEESRNLITLNRRSSYPSDFASKFDEFTVSDDEVVIKGVTGVSGTIYLGFDETTFDAGVYYVQYDGVFPNNVHLTALGTQYKLIETKSKKITLAESKTLTSFSIYVANTTDEIDFKGHIWITKDEPQEYIKKGTAKEYPQVVKQNEFAPIKDALIDYDKDIEPRKHVIIWNYDLTALDYRLERMLENGWSATWQVVPETKQNVINTLIKNGQDLSLYGGFEDSQTVEEIRESIQSRIDAIEEKGVFRTTMFSCSGHKGGDKLQQAILPLGFRYIRASVWVKADGTETYPTTKTFPNEKRQDVRAMVAWKNNTFDEIKNIIYARVFGDYPMTMLMLHTCEYDGFAEDKFNQVVAYVKELENNGDVKVMSATEYFEYYYPQLAKKDERIRIASAIANRYV